MTTRSKSRAKTSPPRSNFVPLTMFLKKDDDSEMVVTDPPPVPSQTLLQTNSEQSTSISASGDNCQKMNSSSVSPLKNVSEQQQEMTGGEVSSDESLHQKMEKNESSDGFASTSTTPTTVASETSKKIHPFFSMGFKKKKEQATSNNKKLSLKSEGTVKLTNDTSPDTIVTSIAEVFMTSEQKKRKRELKNLQSFKQDIERAKELDSLFCKPYTGDVSKHPLLLSMQKKEKTESNINRLTHNSDSELYEGWTSVPLRDVSTSSVWTHGPAVHVLQSDDPFFLRVCEPYELSNTYLPIDNDDEETNSEDGNADYMERDARLIEKELQQTMSDDTDWWQRYLAADGTKTKRRISGSSSISGGNMMNSTDSPAPTIENKLHTIEQYMKIAESKLVELSKKYVGFDANWAIQLYRSFVSRRLNNDPESFDLFANTGELWTQKYRPMTKHEIVGSNAAVVDQLWSWMNDWESFRESTKNRRKKRKLDANKNKKIASFLMLDEDDYNNESDVDSEDEFDPMNNNLIMLTGDISSKTAAVYASAQELGLHVFEINSSSERSQASIMKLIEITQSHQIHRFLSNNKQALESSEAQSGKLQSSSVLLFEEVDNLFEPDKNFFAAIKKIQKTTKRPLILTSNSMLWCPLSC